MRIAIILLACCVVSAATESWTGIHGGGPRWCASPTVVQPGHLRIAWCAELASPAGIKGVLPTCRNVVLHDGRIVVVGPAASGMAQVVQYDTATGAVAASFVTTQEFQGHGHITWPTGMWCDANDVVRGGITLTWSAAGSLLILNAGGDNGNTTAWHMPDGAPAFTDLPSEAAQARAAITFETTKGRRRGLVAGELTKGQNRSGYVDVAWPWLVGTLSGHHQQAVPRFHLFDVRTGLEASLENLEGWQVTESRLVPATSHGLVAFAKGAGISLCDGLLVMVGPGQDADGRGRLGDSGKQSNRPFTSEDVRDRPLWQAPDQGMVIAAWSATGDPLHLAPAWAHLVASARLPVNGPLDAGSYIEADGFYRLKTLLRDGADVWMTWKPGVPEPLQVLHVTATEVRAIDLGFGQGVQGHEIWPQVARTADNGHPSIALLAGNQFDRPYLGAKPIFQVHEGFWAKELKPPRAPMYLACVDARTERVRWTTEVPGMTPNEPVGQIVRTHLVCTGNWAWVGCVITAGAGEAHLRLVAYDLRADSAIARIHEVPLGFAGHDFPDSTLTDLIAADGRIFALVHRAAELTPRVVRWDRQIVLALEPGTTP